jgi:3-dehydroquinate synthase
MRGIETLYVPTTLLAQVDAAIGGKTAVNVAGVRNLAGTVHQPRHVLMCPAFLRTLTARELRSGFVEALKMGIANSESLADAVQRAEAQVVDGRLPSNLEEVVRLSLQAKLHVVELDAHDRSLRLSLNFGHTYAHALEAAEPDRHAHGEAVAFGILAATEMAAEVRNLSHERRTWIRDRSMPFALPVGAEHDIPRIIAAMTGDKKRLPQMLRFVLPTEVTGCVIYETDDRELIARSIERASSAIASETLA